MIAEPVEAKKERGPYATGMARREKILDAAVDLLAEVGYHGMSLRDVARRVGISHPGVIYHFPSKEALLMSVITRYERDLGVELEQLLTDPPLQVFDSLVKLLVGMTATPLIVELETMMLVEATSELHPANAHFSARMEQFSKVLQRAWGQLQAEGKLVGQQDPQILAQGFKSLWYGALIMWLYNRSVDICQPIVNYIAVALTPDCTNEFKRYLSAERDSNSGTASKDSSA